MIKNQGNFLNRVINVEAANPDDARRKRLLNIILVGVLILSASTVLIAFVTSLLGAPIRSTLYIVGLGFGLSTSVFYFLNRSTKVPVWVAGSLFILFLMAIFAFTDTPQELAGGRSLFVFMLPVVIASVLLRPIASFIFAFFAAVELVLIALSANIFPNTPAIA